MGWISQVSCLSRRFSNMLPRDAGKLCFGGKNQIEKMSSTCTLQPELSGLDRRHSRREDNSWSQVQVLTPLLLAERCWAGRLASLNCSFLNWHLICLASCLFHGRRGDNEYVKFTYFCLFFISPIPKIREVSYKKIRILSLKAILMCNGTYLQKVILIIWISLGISLWKEDSPMSERAEMIIH